MAVFESAPWVSGWLAVGTSGCGVSVSRVAVRRARGDDGLVGERPEDGSSVDLDRLMPKESTNLRRPGVVFPLTATVSFGERGISDGAASLIRGLPSCSELRSGLVADSCPRRRKSGFKDFWALSDAAAVAECSRLGCGTSPALCLRGREASRVFLLGDEPFSYRETIAFDSLVETLFSMIGECVESIESSCSVVAPGSFRLRFRRIMRCASSSSDNGRS